jgi:galactoside 2-L-fucosyltransferase 1/2
MAVSYWTQDVDTQQAIPLTLSTYPQNEMLVFESTLCSSPNIPIKPPPNNNIGCPHKPIVTVQQLGRLGNQMYEYISVWAIATKTGHEPYVPSCMIEELGKIFRNLPVPPLSYLAYCPLGEHPVLVTVDKLNHSNGSIILPNYIQLPTYIAPLLGEIRQIFQFKEHIEDESQRLLHRASRGMKNITYVGVHVRRTDYIGYLKRKFNASPVKPDYFLRHMNVFRNKYQRVMFVVVSDDPKWCERELRGDDVVVMQTDSPVQDLAVMSACNHSVIDYGTYGVWGALLSGGDTFIYNLTNSAPCTLASLLPNWYIVTKQNRTSKICVRFEVFTLLSRRILIPLVYCTMLVPTSFGRYNYNKFH